jgi:hypothetical protein
VFYINEVESLASDKHSSLLGLLRSYKENEMTPGLHRWHPLWRVCSFDDGEKKPDGGKPDERKTGKRERKTGEQNLGLLANAVKHN